MHRWLVCAAAGFLLAAHVLGCGSAKSRSQQRVERERELVSEGAADEVEDDAVPADEDAAPRWRVNAICIDAGHGGRDSGVVAQNGILEKDVTLDIAKRLRAALEDEGAVVVMTRTDDRFVPLTKRAEICNAARAGLFLSIHANGFYDADVFGFEVYYLGKRSSPQAGRAAQAIRRALNAALDTRDRGVRRAEFAVLWWTACPAVLVEVGYLSNPEERERLKDEDYRQKIAEALAEALVEFCTEPREAPAEEAQGAGAQGAGAQGAGAQGAGAR